MPVLLVSHTSETFGMLNPAYLTLSRHNIYYFRFPIPPSLHPQGKARDVKLSLQTRCPQEALRLARSLFIFAEDYLRILATLNMDYEFLRDKLTEYFKDRLEMHKERLSRNGPLSEEKRQALQRMFEETHQMATQHLIKPLRNMVVQEPSVLITALNLYRRSWICGLGHMA